MVWRACRRSSQGSYPQLLGHQIRHWLRNKSALPAVIPLRAIYATQDFAQRRSQSAPLSITYGSTELVNAEAFFEQLMDLGQKQG